MVPAGRHAFKANVSWAANLVHAASAKYEPDRYTNDAGVGTAEEATVGTAEGALEEETVGAIEVAVAVGASECATVGNKVGVSVGDRVGEDGVAIYSTYVL